MKYHAVTLAETKIQQIQTTGPYKRKSKNHKSKDHYNMNGQKAKQQISKVPYIQAIRAPGLPGRRRRPSVHVRHTEDHCFYSRRL